MVFAIVGHHLSFLFLSLSLFISLRPTFFGRESSKNSLPQNFTDQPLTPFFSPLPLLLLFPFANKIEDSSHCLGFFPFLLVRIVFTKLSGSIVITHKERGVPWEGNNNRKGNLIESRSSIGCGTRDKMIVSNDSFPRYANPHILQFHSNWFVNCSSTRFAT